MTLWKDQWLPEAGGEGMDRCSTDGFKDNEHTLHGTIKMAPFAQTNRMYNSKSEPQCKRGLWVMLRYQCRFIHYRKYTTLEGDVDSAGGCARMGAVGIWELCTLCSVLL